MSEDCATLEFTTQNSCGDILDLGKLEFQCIRKAVVRNRQEHGTTAKSRSAKISLNSAAGQEQYRPSCSYILYRLFKKQIFSWFIQFCFSFNFAFSTFFPKQTQGESRGTKY